MRGNDTNKIMVIGISKTVGNADLSEMFSDFGTVAEAKVVMDSSSEPAKSKGFGFVTFSSAAAKDNAIKRMNKKVIDGRILHVREVVPKSARPIPASPTLENQEKSVCWAFQRGTCKKGAACQFSHDPRPGEYGTCFEFVQQGKCNRGDACRFQHIERTSQQHSEDGSKILEKAKADYEEVSVAKDATTSESSNEPRVCFAFQKGKCHRGKGCRFLHKLLKQEDHEPEQSKLTKRKRDDVSSTNDEHMDVGRKTSKIKHDSTADYINKKYPLQNTAKLAKLLNLEEEFKKLYENAKNDRIKEEQFLTANRVNAKSDMPVAAPRDDVDTTTYSKKVAKIHPPSAFVNESSDEEFVEVEGSDEVEDSEVKMQSDEDDRDMIDDIVKQAMANDPSTSNSTFCSLKQELKPTTKQEPNNIQKSKTIVTPKKSSEEWKKSRNKMSMSRKERQIAKKEALKRLKTKSNE